jgi:hypothetical protein
MRMVRIYVLFHDGVFKDVFASFSQAMRYKHSGGCCVIRTFEREDY